jgi:ABC-type transport system involved in multi-copper enzyme maturation permease subunit
VTARARAVAALELAVQRRDPLTALYPLVLGLLAFAYASGGPVELVPSRGAVPRTAPWALALACTGLVAFGQVITTMVAATVVLRDRAVRMDALLATGALRRGEYLVGKLAASLVVLAVVYAAIPLGLWLGIVVDRGLGTALAPATLGAILRPFAALVLPVMLGVGALQFAAGALAGRLWFIVGQGLVLLWLWGAALGAAQAGTADVPAWLDPFASAPLVAATRAWPDALRTTAALPLDGAWLANRVVWLALAALAIGATFARATIAAPVAGHAARRPRDEAEDGATVAKAPAGDAWRRTAAAPLGPFAVARAVAGYTARWMLRDPGWRVLAALGAINVAVQARRAVAPGAAPALAAAQALAAMQTHARLFLILLATIYAGELVWREREQRTASLLDALPVGTRAVAVGGLAGVVWAQVVLVALLAAVAWLVAALRAGAPPALAPFAAWTAAWILAPFVAWLLGTWVVHVLVQHKVIAHLCCIAAWVAAVTVDARLQAAAWWRALAWPGVDATVFARGGAPWEQVLPTVATWLGAGVLGVLVVSPFVVRGPSRRTH